MLRTLRVTLQQQIRPVSLTHSAIEIVVCGGGVMTRDVWSICFTVLHRNVLKQIPPISHFTC